MYIKNIAHKIYLYLSYMCFRMTPKFYLGQKKQHIVSDKMFLVLVMLSVLCFSASILFFPEFCFAEIAEIGDLKSLAKTVQDDVHSYGIPIILNTAGAAVAGFALVTQRWTMLIFGAAYLIFVNIFFGFVKGKFGIK
ncbi:membrane hypothetical protein [Alphaproteobacteria bacterium]